MSRLFLMGLVLEEASLLDKIIEKRVKRIKYMSSYCRDRDRGYVNKYNLSEDLIKKLAVELQKYLKIWKLSSNSRRITTRVKLLCTLSFLASGCYQSDIGKDINTVFSQQSASNCIREVVEALSHPSIVKKYIRYPENAEEIHKVQRKFYEIYNIPGVLGCVDSTFISLVKPVETPDKYSMYKENANGGKTHYAKNVLLVTDADLNIIYVDPTQGGATYGHDIFNNSVIKKRLEHVANSGETVYLLGHSGYEQRSYLMTPVPNAEQGTPEAHYNDLHATAYKSMAMTINRLKSRFKCMLSKKTLFYRPYIADKIVIACCVLHNICNRAGLPATSLDSSHLKEELRFCTEWRYRGRNKTSSQCDLATGKLRRLQLIRDLWDSRCPLQLSVTE